MSTREPTSSNGGRKLTISSSADWFPPGDGFDGAGKNANGRGPGHDAHTTQATRQNPNTFGGRRTD
jgi:hypothetical protein